MSERTVQRDRDRAIRLLLREDPLGLTVSVVAARLGITPTGARRRLRDATHRGVVRALAGTPTRWVPAQARVDADRGLLLVEALGRFSPDERVEALHAAAVLLGDAALVSLIPVTARRA